MKRAASKLRIKKNETLQYGMELELGDGTGQLEMTVQSSLLESHLGELKALEFSFSSLEMHPDFAYLLHNQCTK